MEAIKIDIPDILAGAIEVCAGLHGVGQDRVKSLKEAGYDPSDVQACVNELFPLWKKYGGR